MMKAVRWLALAALTDWLIARTITRAAIFMPKPPLVLALYQALSQAGQVATTLVSLLGLGVIAWIAWREWQGQRALSLALLGQVALSLLFLFVPAAGGWGLAGHLLYLVAVGLLLVRAWRLAVLLPALALAAGRLYQTLPTLYTTLAWPGSSPWAVPLFNLGEVVVVLSAVGLWYIQGQGASWRVWLGATLPAVLFVVGYALNPAMTAVIAIWSIGLTLYLPWPFYALALWLAGVTVIVSLRRGTPVGWAILLLAAGGYAPQLSSQLFLGLIGLWLLAEPETRPEAAPATIPLKSLRTAP